MLGPASQAEIQRYVEVLVWMGDTHTHTQKHTDTHLYAACWDRERNASSTVILADSGLLSNSFHI